MLLHLTLPIYTKLKPYHTSGNRLNSIDKIFVLVFIYPNSHQINPNRQILSFIHYYSNHHIF